MSNTIETQPTLIESLPKGTRHIISTPFIWAPLIAFVILDFFLELYHRICFPLYGMELVDRSKYIRIDRQKLSYLSPLQKVFCMYCGYGNGILAYSAEVAARTEKYWCAVQHEQDANFIAPPHHKGFAKYGDKADYDKQPSQYEQEK